MTPRNPSDPGHDDENDPSSTLSVPGADSFLEDERAISSQFDLMFAILIYAAVFSIFLAVSTSLIFNAAGADNSNRMVADRGADRLADDYLVDTPNEAVLNRSCTKAFFEKRTPGGCGYADSWSNTAPDSPEHYLNNALAIEPGKQVNVTLRTTGGSIGSLDGTTLALGEAPPTDHGTVYAFHRHVGLDKNDDGAPEWYTLVVEVW